MTVKEVLSACIVRMGESDYIDNATYTAAQQKEIDLLLVGLNHTMTVLAGDYFPLEYCEEVSVSGGELQYSSLSKLIYRPLKLVDSNGIKQPYRVLPDRLVCSDGTYKLYYLYVPETLEIGDNLGEMRVSKETIVDGTLSEYYFLSEHFDYATAYNRRFLSSAESERIRVFEPSLKTRVWA